MCVPPQFCRPFSKRKNELAGQYAASVIWILTTHDLVQLYSIIFKSNTNFLYERRFLCNESRINPFHT